VKENAFLEFEHDLYALARLMNLFATTESLEQWSAVCKAVSNGDIEQAIKCWNSSGCRFDSQTAPLWMDIMLQKVPKKIKT
jgi:hypothetical protein